MKIDINEYTLALLLILMLAPIFNHISKIKIGSILEAEITKEYHEKVIKLYESTEGDVNSKKSDKKPTTEFVSEASESIKNNVAYKYQDIINTSNISLVAGIVKLRNNLENQLLFLYKLKHQDNYQNIGALSCIDLLLKEDIITQNLAVSLREVIDIANRAIHGNGDIRAEDVKLAILAGVNLLERIDNSINIIIKEQKEKNKITIDKKTIV